MRPQLKYTISFILTALFFYFAAKKDTLDYEKHIYFLEGDTISCVVKSEGGIYLKRGHTVGFHFDLLKKFGKYERCDANIKAAGKEDIWKDLIEDKIDIIVIDSKKDTVPEIYQSEIVSSIDLNNKEDVWVVKKSNYRLMQHLNYWLSYFKQSKGYNSLINNYYKKYRGISLSSSGAVGLLSPYDQIIKRHATKINWDWRLLAALIYQESKFSTAAQSSRGAHGLMQIKKATASQFGIEDIYNPEQNVLAGTMLIRKLQKLYKSDDIDSINRVKFVLAAYNAGEGRISDCRSFAEYKGVNHNDWNQVKDVIPLMKKGGFPSDLIKFGSFKGVETINFVDQIISRYEEYKSLVKK